MAGRQVIASIDAHAEGEPGRIVMGAHLQVRGETMAERLRWCSDHLDDLRALLLQEPRGYPATCAVLVLPPVDPRSDVGIIILEQGGFRPMSGSNTMCAVTALLETGALPMTEPETIVRIDTASGLVEAIASVSGDKVTSVRVRNVPAWVAHLGRPIEVPEYGRVAADVAFGGQFYVQATAASMGVDLDPANAQEIVRAGMALLASAREQVPVRHPVAPEIDQISLVMLHEPAERAADGSLTARASVILPNGELVAADPASWRGSLDRSPCGTGTSARMACLHARGELGLDEPFHHRGILGTTFTGRLHERTTVGDHDAVVPSIEGRAWITGSHQHVLDPSDPFPRGYTLGDIWAASSW